MKKTGLKGSVQLFSVDFNLNWHTNEYNEEFHNYSFVAKLDRCVGSCNTLNDLPNKVCVPNKTEDLSIHVFKMIKGKNE